jgi:signal transduction histidine kinase
LSRNHVEDKIDMYIWYMKIRRTMITPVVIVTLAMIIILPLLAYMQYTWLGQVSEQEYRRMQENVRTSAFHCSMQFSQEIAGLVKSLGGVLTGSKYVVQTTLLSRIHKWKLSALHPSIVSSEISIASLPPVDRVIRINSDETSAVFLLHDFSSFAIPIEDNPGKAVFISLDTQAVQSSLIPDIIQSYLSSPVRDEYDIVVLDYKGSIVFSSRDTLKHSNLDHADIAIPFLLFPPVPLSFLPFNRMNRENIFPEEEARPELLDKMRRDFEQRRETSPPGETMFPRRRGMGIEEKPIFELRLKHRDGSLEAAVNNNRLRSLAISFGILLLLGTSMIFLLLSATRAQKLAHQQLEFVAGVSHELRTPLAVLKSAGENLADGVIHEREKSRAYGELIKKEVIRLSEMVEKALAYAGIQSGKQSYDLIPVQIKEIVVEAIKNTRKLVSGECIIESDIAEHLPNVLANNPALQSALENLLINAIKYSRGKKWVRIEAHSHDLSKKPSLEIIIRDNGMGIAPSDIDHIFDPFYRGHNAIDSQIEGSGLGLSITKHIIEAHKGIISVKSSLQSGTTFTIHLPITSKDGMKA